MRFFFKAPDGGVNSGVTGYWLIESKRLFSIVLLHFEEGSREAFHSHAFNAVTFWVKGKVKEIFPPETGQSFKVWFRGPKYTPRNLFHRVVPVGPSKDAWAVSFRGPWRNTWQEYKDGESYTLTHGRKMVDANVNTGR